MIFLFCTLCLLVTIYNGMESFGINIFSADLDPSKMEMKMIKTTLKAKKQMDQKLYITHAEFSWQISKNTCILQLFCNNMMNCPCISLILNQHLILNLYDLQWSNSSMAMIKKKFSMVFFRMERTQYQKQSLP